jgi:uncharacterized membrane protein YvbJ
MDGDTKYCPECGQQLMAEANFCDRCGTEQLPSGGEPDTPTGASSETVQHQQPNRHQPTPTPPGADTDSKIGAALKWIGAFFVVITLAMVVSSFVLGLSDAGDGPEATVEDYYGAADDGDTAEMQTLIHTDAPDDVTNFGDGTLEVLSSEIDISVEETELLSEGESQAQVRAVVTISGQDGTLTLEGLHDLRKEGDEWRLYDLESEIVDVSQ